MGNETSTLKERNLDEINIVRLIDSIATKYILTQNFSDLQKLEDKKYCDDLTILTSKIIKDRLTSLEVQYLNQRTKSGMLIDEEDKDNIVFLKDSDLNKLDIQNQTKKKRVCIGISRTKPYGSKINTLLTTSSTNKP